MEVQDGVQQGHCYTLTSLRKYRRTKHFELHHFFALLLCSSFYFLIFSHFFSFFLCFDFEDEMPDLDIELAAKLRPVDSNLCVSSVDSEVLSVPFALPRKRT